MKKLLVGVAVLLVIAAPTWASTITMDFSGTVDLSGVGGAASNAYNGSVTWDPAALPVNSFPDGHQYTAENGSFTFNSTDYSASILQTSIFVGDNASGVADFFDVSHVFFSNVPSLSVTVADTIPSTNLLVFATDLSGPTSMFSSTALPGNLDFLGSVSSSSARLTTKQGNLPGVDTFGSFTATAPTASVPEPPTLALTALGLLALVLTLRGRMRVI